MIKVLDLNAYYGQFHVLKDVSITVDEKEVVVIVGPNGHGKSTLLKSICGLADKTTGEIMFNNTSLINLSTLFMKRIGLTLSLSA